MHETALLKNLFRYLEREESSSSRRIKGIQVSLSELSGINAEHFRDSYKNSAAGTRWEALEIEIKKIPYGPQLEITRLDFA
jgi:Zn finger protein HypA/HybF involved in hydrogenase expression